MAIALHDKPTVVCVDDEPLVRKSLYRCLSREPLDVVMAETPGQALKYVREHEVDLVIADQRMPEMSGVELLREVHEVSPRTAGLILTAYPESVMADDPPASPGPPLFSKPWDDETLRESVRELIRKPVPKIRSVVVPVDGSIEPELALGSVLPLLKGDPVRIHLVQVVQGFGLHRDVYAYLERTRARLESEKVEATADMRWGDPAEQILLHAKHLEADLVVLPPPLQSESRFGRTLAERILERGDLAVVVGRADVSVRSWRRILVPLDGSREAESALPDAVRMAREMGAWIDLLGVYRPLVQWGYGRYVPEVAPARDWVAYLMDVSKYIEMADVPTEIHVVEGDVAAEIVAQAEGEGADLICMGTRRKGWFSRFFGGVTRAVVRRAPCPVFLRRANSAG